jgi:hypothetical protein
MMFRRRSFSLLLSALSLGCGVPEPPGPTGVVTLPEPGVCGRGFIVLESNYQSTNVGLLTLDGEVLTGSLVKSTLLSGELLPTLSGDVVGSSSTAEGSSAVLIDRAPDSSRLAFVDLSTGRIDKYIDLGTGFPSNPQDYAEVSADKAYVTRFGHNRNAGRTPFDAGSDVLVVSLETNEIVASIDLRSSLMGAAESNLPRPSRIVVADDRAFVLLTTLPVAGFVATDESRLAIVDTATDSVVESIALPGLRNCGGMALSAAGDRLAVFCSALTDADGGSDVEASGIALLTLGPRPQLERVIPGSLLGSQPVGFSGAFVTTELLMVTSFGALEGSTVIANDRLLSVDLPSDEVTTLLEGSPFSLGGVKCAGPCGTCMVADASRAGGVLHRYTHDEAGVSLDDSIKVETQIGLPPRYLARF